VSADPDACAETYVDAVVAAAMRAGHAVSGGPVAGEIQLQDGLPLLDPEACVIEGSFSHSRLEASGRDLVREVLEPLGLHVEDEPFEVRHEGRIIAEADIAVVEILLDFEVDGPVHRFTDQREADAQRDRLMRRVRWEVERLPEELIRERPVVARARIRDAALRRMEELGRTPP
jgi:hypothetical protein